ncbi:MAG: class I SAM-dependent methyltransferase [Planctomycetales bacterium]|nr:class I SAM-dependent methyltransferase [Planctomycetales bacterium]
MLDLFRPEPLYHYEMDRFSLKSPIIYREGHRVVHLGGGPNRNHPMELNINPFKMRNVDVVARGEAIPFADASVDVIISAAVLEHVEDIQQSVGEINRVLKPGGFVYIEIPFMQHYHTHDFYGVEFEDYRRFTKVGLAQAFEFCDPLDVGACVGPTSTVAQMVYSFFNDLNTSPLYRRMVKGMYHVVGNSVVWVDRYLPNDVIERSHIPSGIFYFGRKRDEHSDWLRQLPQPHSIFPKHPAAEIKLVSHRSGVATVRLTNTGDTTWLRHSPFAWGNVQLGVRRVVPEGEDIDVSRVDLAADIAPGASCELAVPIDPADTSTLKIDLVNEGLHWFSQRGSEPLLVPPRHAAAA